MKHEIEVFANFVLAFGQRIERPSRVSVAQWYTYWEKLIRPIKITAVVQGEY